MVFDKFVKGASMVKMVTRFGILGKFQLEYTLLLCKTFCSPKSVSGPEMMFGTNVHSSTCERNRMRECLKRRR